MKVATHLLILFVITFYSACKRLPDPPQLVTKAFNEKFPHATKVNWAIENECCWKAKFVNNNRQHVARFNLNGNWLETKVPLNKSEIPSLVVDKALGLYPKYNIKKIQISENRKRGFAFEVILMNEDSITEIAIDRKGYLIEEQKIIRKE